MEKIANQSKNLSERIGDMIWSMKPGKDEFMTLSSRIKNFANEIMGESNINYRIEIDKEADTQILDITQRKNIVLITKEAINNAVKYSQGTELLVSIKCVEENIILLIKDNGIGFDAAESKGNGLSNMRKRAQEIGAQFEVVSMPQKGTEIKLEMKL
jgi:signal transduction histidine kinase